jgi:hypothetical protein
MAASQTKQALWMVAGYLLLVPFCLAQAWEPCESTINPFERPARPISKWKWAWLNTIYGNREDGVSGAEALVWVTEPAGWTHRVLYRPNTWAPLRAWLWSAWRNSTNELSR